MTNLAAEAPIVSGRRHDAGEHARRLATSLSARDAVALRRLLKLKVPKPRRVLVAAKKAKLPLSLAVALVLEERELLHGAELVNRFAKLSVLVRQLGVGKGAEAYRADEGDAAAFAGRLERREGELAVALGEEAARPARVVVNPGNWWKKSVVGDTDCERPLLCALANVGKDLGVTIYVRQGRRTIAEQQYLYELYLAGKGNLAAKPNLNAPHVRGIAADCGIGSAQGLNIGDYRGAREAMKRRGLCLSVQGETWHVQRGTNWAARKVQARCIAKATAARPASAEQIHALPDTAATATARSRNRF